MAAHWRRVCGAACLALAALGAASTALAGEPGGECFRSSDTGRHADGSLLRLDTLVCPDSTTRLDAAYTARASEPLRPLLTRAFDEFHMAQLLDFDGDGWLDVQVTITCAAAPNCEHAVYRFDPKRSRLYAYFENGWTDVIVEPGRVVTSVKGGAAGWGYAVHAIEPSDPPVVRADPEFDIYISMDGTFDDDNTDEALRERPRCEFGAYRNGERVRIAPPAPEWLDHCSRYGDDYLLKLPAPPPHASVKDPR